MKALSHDERGSFLIVVLWAMSILSILTAGLVFQASQSLMVMKREKKTFQEKTDFMSVFYEICAKISSDELPYEDNAGESWYGKIQLTEPFAKRVMAEVEDEGAKINLNEASERLLKTAFKRLEEDGVVFKGDWKGYVKGILKLRTRKKIQSLEELLLIEDFHEEDMDLMIPWMTVYSESPQVNINTADPEVLETLIDAIPGDRGAHLLLTGRLRQFCVENGKMNGRCDFLSRELEPDLFLQRLKLPRTPLTLMLVQEFLAKVSTDSETFRLKMRTESQRQAETIFRLRPGQLTPEVFYWHEN